MVDQRSSSKGSWFSTFLVLRLLIYITSVVRALCRTLKSISIFVGRGRRAREGLYRQTMPYDIWPSSSAACVAHHLAIAMMPRGGRVSWIKSGQLYHYQRVMAPRFARPRWGRASWGNARGPSVMRQRGRGTNMIQFVRFLSCDVSVYDMRQPEKYGNAISAKIFILILNINISPFTNIIRTKLLVRQAEN